MLDKFFDYFTELYSEILASKPDLAHEHALEQELEIYKEANKITYRTVGEILESSAILNPRLIYV